MSPGMHFVPCQIKDQPHMIVSSPRAPVLERTHQSCEHPHLCACPSGIHTFPFRSDIIPLASGPLPLSYIPVPQLHSEIPFGPYNMDQSVHHQMYDSREFPGHSSWTGNSIKPTPINVELSEMTSDYAEMPHPSTKTTTTVEREVLDVAPGSHTLFMPIPRRHLLPGFVLNGYDYMMMSTKILANSLRRRCVITGAPALQW